MDILINSGRSEWPEGIFDNNIQSLNFRLVIFIKMVLARFRTVNSLRFGGTRTKSRSSWKKILVSSKDFTIHNSALFTDSVLRTVVYITSSIDQLLRIQIAVLTKGLCGLV